MSDAVGLADALKGITRSDTAPVASSSVNPSRSDKSWYASAASQVLSRPDSADFGRYQTNRYLNKRIEHNLHSQHRGKSQRYGGSRAADPLQDFCRNRMNHAQFSDPSTQSLPTATYALPSFHGDQHPASDVMDMPRLRVQIYSPVRRGTEARSRPPTRSAPSTFPHERPKNQSTMILSHPAYLARRNRRHGRTRGPATASSIMLFGAFAKVIYDDFIALASKSTMILSRLRGDSR